MFLSFPLKEHIGFMLLIVLHILKYEIYWIFFISTINHFQSNCHIILGTLCVTDQHYVDPDQGFDDCGASPGAQTTPYTFSSFYHGQSAYVYNFESWTWTCEELPVHCNPRLGWNVWPWCYEAAHCTTVPTSASITNLTMYHRPLLELQRFVKRHYLLRNYGIIKCKYYPQELWKFLKKAPITNHSTTKCIFVSPSIVIYFFLHHAGLEWDLYKNLYGQHLVQDIVSESVTSFLHKPNPDRPLVLSFHGASGTGKSMVSSMLARHLYGTSMGSPYIHQYVPTLHFPLAGRVEQYRVLYIYSFSSWSKMTQNCS